MTLAYLRFRTKELEGTFVELHQIAQLVKKKVR